MAAKDLLTLVPMSELATKIEETGANPPHTDAFEVSYSQSFEALGSSGKTGDPRLLIIGSDLFDTIWRC